jgi:hypothetical protein
MGHKKSAAKIGCKKSACVSDKDDEYIRIYAQLQLDILRVIGRDRRWVVNSLTEITVTQM